MSCRQRRKNGSTLRIPARVIDGEIWGRGAQDCKSLGVVELLAFLLLKREGIQPQAGYRLYGHGRRRNRGEMGGRLALRKSPGLDEGRVRDQRGRRRRAWSMGQKHVYTCQTAEKGICWLKLTFRGKPGHGSIPHDDNCVVKMAKAIERISAYRSPPAANPDNGKFHQRDCRRAGLSQDPSR